MRVLLCVVGLIAHSIAVPLSAPVEVKRLDRIERDLSTITRLLKDSLDGQASKTADGVTTPIPAEVQPAQIMKKAIINKLQKPPNSDPKHGTPVDTQDAPAVIVPLPGDHSHEYEKLPEPIINPNDKYESAEDADLALYRSMTLDPCVTQTLMPEPDETHRANKIKCGVPGAHQLGRSRSPGHDAVMCPGSPIECSGNGVCEHGTCRCNSLYHGLDCSLLRCSPPCSTKGVCMNATCECSLGWRGPTCSDKACVPDCSVHGVCREGLCECDPGYQGSTCAERMCPGKPHCSGSDHGICDYETGTCLCLGNWEGADCSEEGIPCDPPCLNRGKCHAGVCECAPGWQGADCGTIIPRSYRCEGGAVWSEEAPSILRTCSNVYEEIPDDNGGARCVCPSSHPVWDVETRSCVDETFCGKTECGVMAIPAVDEVVFGVKSNTECAGGPNNGTCPGCVQGHLPVQVCWRMGRVLAERLGNARNAYVALYREGGACEGDIDQTPPPSLEPTQEGKVGQTRSVDSSDDGAVTITNTSEVTVPRHLSFSGVPHMTMEYGHRHTSSSVTFNVNCTGTYKAALILEDVDGNADLFGNCKFVSQNAACPGSPPCMGHGKCVATFTEAHCECDDNYHGNDCSVRYVELPSGPITVVPGPGGTNISTSLPVPEDTTVTRTDDTVTLTAPDGTTTTFFPNNSVNVEHPDGSTETIHEQSPDAPEPHTCPGNTQFMACSSGCFPTCRNPYPRCLPTCLQGACQCPFETPLWDELREECVPLKKCSEQSPCPGIGAACSGKGSCINGTCQCIERWSGDDCSVYYHPGPRVTTSGGTVGQVTPCEFPFKFRGREYTDCTTDYDSDGKEWCSVTYEWEQRWGYCAPRGSCPAVNGIECNGQGICEDSKCTCLHNYFGVDCSKRVVRYTNVTQEMCEFPFLGPDLREYSDCIPGMPIISEGQLTGVASSSQGESWCLKSFRFSGVESFGYCQPKGSCGNCSATGGVCDPSGSGMCHCKPGFSGIACDYRMSEKDILLKLYVDANGHGWNKQFGWSTASEPCDVPTWSGITCRNGRVVRVNLDSSNLIGVIPVDLSALTALEVLDLSNNRLSGGFPSELTQTPATLRSIIISNNFLTGLTPSMPAHVTYSDVSNNLFTKSEDIDPDATLRVTNGVGSAEKFERCHFPFEYNGKNYSTCTSDWYKAGPWCSTTPGYHGQWGECAALGTCPGTGGEECSGRGECQRVSETTIAVKCKCESGWTGDDCGTVVKRAIVASATGVSEPHHGKACQLPFEYHGKVYKDCTSDGSKDGREWCLTTKVWEREWGFCSPQGTCPGSPQECSGHGSCNSKSAECECEDGWGYDDCSYKIPRVTDGTHQRKGVLCHFPFTLGGKEYTTCTTAPSFTGRPYCAVAGGRLEDHQEWDFCADVGTCPGEPQCSDHGECFFGECACNAGFKGSDCSELMDERDVLVKLFRSTNGLGWIDSTSWEVEGHYCSWYGITCDEAGHTIAIDLAQNNLEGTIPADLGLIRTLQSVNLADNPLAGSLPSSLRLITGLELFNVTNTELVGALPEIHTSQLECDETCIASAQCTHRGVCGP